MRRLLGLLALLCALSAPALVTAGAPATALAAKTHAAHPRAHPAHPRRGHAAAPSDATANAILDDCQAHGALTKQYSKADLRRALAIMSASTKQYSNCQDVIQQALAHGINVSGGGGGSGSSGGGSSATTIIIIVVVILVLLGVTLGGLAIRRRRMRGGGSGGAGGSEDPTRVRPPGEA